MCILTKPIRYFIVNVNNMCIISISWYGIFLTKLLHFCILEFRYIYNDPGAWPLLVNALSLLAQSIENACVKTLSRYKWYRSHHNVKQSTIRLIISCQSLPMSRHTCIPRYFELHVQYFCIMYTLFFYNFYFSFQQILPVFLCINNVCFAKTIVTILFCSLRTIIYFLLF